MLHQQTLIAVNKEKKKFNIGNCLLIKDLGSIPGRVIPKTLKMVLDNSLLNTQQYKVIIKGKMEPSLERSSAFPYTSV